MRAAYDIRHERKLRAEIGREARAAPRTCFHFIADVQPPQGLIFCLVIDDLRFDRAAAARHHGHGERR